MIKKIAFVLLFSVLLIQIVSSEISDAGFSIKISNGTLEITNSDYSGNNKNFSFNNSGLNEFSYNFLFIKNTTVSTDIVDKYADCLNQKSECEVQKSAINLGWNGCLRDLTEVGNISSIQGNLTICQTTQQSLQNDVNLKQGEVEKCKEEQKAKSNQIWLGIAIGLAIGIVGTLFQQKKIKIGGQKKDEEGFNQNQGS